MEPLKALTDEARLGDTAQQAIVLGFFRALQRILSDARLVRHPDGGEVRGVAPVRVCGRGQVLVRGVVTLGVHHSPFLLEGIYLEARTPVSRVLLDDGVVINNGSWIASEGASVTIGKRCLIGPRFSCADSNFHDLHIERRANREPDPQPVVIEDDVFIGEGVTILKGVHVGAGSIIAARSVLTPGFACPPHSTVRGNPAVVVRTQPAG